MEYRATVYTKARRTVGNSVLPEQKVQEERKHWERRVKGPGYNTWYSMRGAYPQRNGESGKIKMIGYTVSSHIMLLNRFCN